MKCQMLIPEKEDGDIPAVAKKGRMEICEATSALACEELINEGWGLLTVVSGHFFQPAMNSMTCGVVYIMMRTAG